MRILRKRYEVEVHEDAPVDAFMASRRFRFRWMARLWAKVTILSKCKALRSKYWMYRDGELIERGYYQFCFGIDEWTIVPE